MGSCFKSSKRKSKKGKRITSSSSSGALLPDEHTEEESAGYVEYGKMTSFDDDDGDDDDDDVFVEKYHTVIIDCAPIGFTDAMGVGMIEQVRKQWDQVHITASACKRILCVVVKNEG